jgi:hypothetical protein
LAENLLHRGYAVCSANDIGLEPELRAGWERLTLAYDQLPPDPYCKNGNRFRRHRRFVALPWARQIVPRPPVPYQQGTSFNPTDGGVRDFSPLGLDSHNAHILRYLIQWDLSQLPLSQADQAIDVGLHMIRMTCSPDIPGVASPNCLHKDGELYTFIHVVRREGIIGGERVVADNDKCVLFEAVLDEPLATLAVFDHAVYHHVKPIHPAPGAKYGYRDVLLIDFTPLVPDIR